MTDKRTLTMDMQQRMLKFVTRSNWWLFAAASVFGLINLPFRFALGIVLGSLLITVNFHLLSRTLKKAFTPSSVLQRGSSIRNAVLIKYYIRFTVSGAIIFLLISKHVVDPIGLILGLSVVVVSIIAATMCEITKLILKEAV